MPTNVMAKYPGEQAYDGGGKIIQKQPYCRWGSIETQFYGHVRLYDINQLLNFCMWRLTMAIVIFLSGDGIETFNTKML